MMAKCYVCEKNNLSKNEIGLTKKLMGRYSKKYYCLSCLAKELEVTETELTDKIMEFKDNGCKLFE